MDIVYALTIAVIHNPGTICLKMYPSFSVGIEALELMH